MTFAYESPQIIVFHGSGRILGMGTGTCSTGTRYLNGCSTGSVPGGIMSFCKTGCGAYYAAGYGDCDHGSFPGTSTIYTQCCTGGSPSGTTGTCMTGSDANSSCATGTEPTCFGCS